MPRKKQSGPVMGARQYAFLARTLANMPEHPAYAYETIVESIGEALARDNPRFKLAVWRYETGLDNEAPAGWRVAETSNEED